MRIFVNYSWKDKEVARDIKSRLAAEGFDVWRDEEVMPGDNWPLAVGGALDESDAMVVLLSPDAMDSETVVHGIQYALAESRFENRLFPVVVRPTRKIPAILRACSLVDWSKNPEEALDHIVRGLREGVGVTS